MSVERAASFQIWDNVWQGAPEPWVARECIQEGHRVSGCTFEVKAAVLEAAVSEADRR